jgi:hypothetical protein
MVAALPAAADAAHVAPVAAALCNTWAAPQPHILFYFYPSLFFSVVPDKE